METRTTTITENKIYKLILNPMMGRCKDGHIVAISYEPQKLLDWKNSLLVEQYTDDDGLNMIGGKLNKVFKKGSELEFYNNIGPGFEYGLFDGTIFEEWVKDYIDLSQFKFIN